MPRQFILALTLALLPAAGSAQSIAFGGMDSDPSAPVEVAADNLSVNQSDGSARFTGNVVIGQGEMRLSADDVTVEYAEGGQDRIRALLARGNVTLVAGEDAAEAQEARYDVAAGTVLLTGDVLLTQGQNVLSGNRITVDIRNGTAQAQGRVRTILQQGTDR
ncbi:lipopolysaccharide transport periplasmic protein LptA [Paracoccus sp. 1_MG-2023]|uniref:lipopolysaccharide transport periplasmic protein LptA n=1 Tax=unclassified Paracoccus (in: a-proteobacteria) TaxID=2688777 RepID=UPI001C089BC7|nr:MULTISPECIES: lipopolysaccharide transport periplasmic protein LptA [unclassified Paracoccus (in: a-proteobacteria)]MBU2956276.1 lipopolysaccharide transport periplasmic protein LptA [Paracoccus sp. C2R09]MDO6667952.1 lipopolysaccharide transport periplasmic protein LptA [Paracoccus sp. 1_MG-2023]